ncbi:unnamed protein product [Diplocarpon coronariae]
MVPVMVMAGSAMTLGSFSAASLVTLSQAALPIVDIGYTVHQATLNSTGSGYFNFSNIRYAQPPVSPLHLSPPLAAVGRNLTVNDGSRGVICPQVGPAWEVEAVLFLAAFLTGQNLTNYIHPTMTQTPASTKLSSLLALNSRTSEDCLFLDVIVNTTSGYHEAQCQAGKNCTVSAGAPVLVWIYGGGYTGGSKTGSGDPSSLIAKSLENDGEGVVYLAMNYRLGLFVGSDKFIRDWSSLPLGWLSGNENITANVGLLDQRLALDWVQQNIYLFGGDPSRVTVMGESAGGGSIMHHITSYGGLGTVPFQQAIPQSPAFQPFVPAQSEAIFSQVLNASSITNMTVSTADDLRALSFEALYALNAILVGRSSYGSFYFGPAVDPKPHSYVPDFPLRLLANGSFHNISLMVGHNSNRGLVFTPPFIQDQRSSEKRLEPSLLLRTSLFCTATITDELYPPVYNVTCPAYYLASKMSPAYGYVFQVPPGLHGQDVVAYTFFNGDNTTLNEGAFVNATVAIAFQRYLTSFAVNGVPTAEGVPGFILYGGHHAVSSISSHFILIPGLGEHITDAAAMEERCRFWAEAPYYSLDD